MTSSKKSSISGWSAAIAVAVIWGVTGVVSKPLSVLIDPMTLVFFRYVTAVFGLLVVFPFISRIKSLKEDVGTKLSISKKDILKIAVCGIIGQGAFSYFNFLSLNYIGATENGIVQGMQPFATLLFGMMFMNYKMNKYQGATFILSMLCIFFLNLGPMNSEGSNNVLLGYIFVACSMLSLAWTTYLRDSLAKKYGSVVSMLYQYIAVALAGLFLVPILQLDLTQIVLIFSSPLLIFLFIFLGTVESGLSYVIQLFSFKRIGVEKSTMALNLLPLVSYIVAVMTLGESVTLVKTIAILLIVIALYYFNRYENKVVVVDIPTVNNTKNS